MESWNVKTYADIKTHLAKGKIVNIILAENIASFGKLSIKDGHKITKVRTCRNVRELEIEIDNRGTYIPINEHDIILFQS
jgi:hypothetical protein